MPKAIAWTAAGAILLGAIFHPPPAPQSRPAAGLSARAMENAGFIPIVPPAAKGQPDDIRAGPRPAFPRKERSGTIRQQPASRGRARKFLVTAYCPCRRCCNKSDGLTALGRRAIPGRTVAVDPRLIPLGAHINLEGLGERVAEDMGGSIAGYRIDVFFASHAEAEAFGRCWLEVRVDWRP